MVEVCAVFGAHWAWLRRGDAELRDAVRRAACECGNDFRVAEFRWAKFQGANERGAECGACRQDNP